MDVEKALRVRLARLNDEVLDVGEYMDVCVAEFDETEHMIAELYRLFPSSKDNVELASDFDAARAHIESRVDAKRAHLEDIVAKRNAVKAQIDEILREENTYICK